VGSVINLLQEGTTSWTGLQPTAWFSMALLDLLPKFNRTATYTNRWIVG